MGSVTCPFTILCRVLKNSEEVIFRFHKASKAHPYIAFGISLPAVIRPRVNSKESMMALSPDGIERRLDALRLARVDSQMNFCWDIRFWCHG
jgi:hypothetical protein